MRFTRGAGHRTPHAPPRPARAQVQSMLGTVEGLGAHVAALDGRLGGMQSQVLRLEAASNITQVRARARACGSTLYARVWQHPSPPQGQACSP